MRKLRLVLSLVITLGALPVGVAGALGLVEGDPGWDCEKMGNGACGEALGPVLLEGDPGWDCATMGNASCGAQPQALEASPIVVAPVYDRTSRTHFCAEQLVMCGTKSWASVRTGALKVSAGALGPGVSPCDPEECDFLRGQAFVRRSLDGSHTTQGSTPSITYRMTMDIKKSQRVVDPLRTLALDSSYVEFRAVSANLLGPVTCSAPTDRGLVPGEVQGDPDLPTGGAPIDPLGGTLVLETTLTCLDRSTFPFTRVDVPDGHEVEVHINAIAIAEPVESLLGTDEPTPVGAAHASFEASRTTVTVS